jgi:TldD protein
MEALIEKIGKLLCQTDKKIDCYIEESITSRVRIRGNHIEDISQSIISGGQIRIHNQLNYNMLTFNSFDKFDDHLALALRNFSSQKISSEDEPILFFQDKADFERAPLDYIVSKLNACNEKIINTDNIDGTIVTYGDICKNIVFLNSTGSIIQQYKQDSIANFVSIVHRNRAFSYPISIGSSYKNDFINNLDQLVYEPLKNIACDNSNEIIPPGNYPVILDPEICGTIIHEVLGHLLEADSFYENPELLRDFPLDKRISSEILHVEDRPDIPFLRGSYYFDDEGTQAQGSCLVENGILKSYLHSNDTAKAFHKKSTGNARLLNYKFRPIVRMSNIIVKPGSSTLSHMMENIEYGAYFVGLNNASTNNKSFTIFPRECFLIQNGKLKGHIHNAYIAGNIDILDNVESLSKETVLNQGYSCNKYSQRGLPVSMQAPFMFLKSCFIGETK